jgi:hypothetical protein
MWLITDQIKSKQCHFDVPSFSASLMHPSSCFSTNVLSQKCMDSERHKQKAMEEAQRYEQAIPPSAPFGGVSHPSYCDLLERKKITKNHKKW